MRRARWPGTAPWSTGGGLWLHEFTPDREHGGDAFVANLHDETAKAMIVIAPGTIGRRYFEEVAEIVSQPGPPDMARLHEVMRRHGLVPV